MHVYSAAPAQSRQTKSPEASRLQTGLHPLSAPTHSLSAWLAVPEHLNPELAPLVAVHGVRRGARNQARQFMQAAREQGRLVIAPLFDTHHWLGYQRIQAQGQRADLALLRLLETVSFQFGVSTRQVALFGYSGGAQFAHRFAMLHPHRVAQLCTCAAGWYTWIEAGAGAFPLGLEASARRRLNLGEVAAANLGRFLQIPTWVTVGALDNQADALTRRDPHLDALQGSHRLERAQRWVQALHSVAASRGMQASARLHVLPDAGHDFAQCMRCGALTQLALPALAPTQWPLAA